MGLNGRRANPSISITLLTAVLAVGVSICTGARAAPRVSNYGGGAYLHASLEEALRTAEAARGPLAYAATRQIWRLWDRADPAQVEVSLLAGAADASRPPALRAYAGLLAAYARLRRGDAAGASRRVAELGYVREWSVLGPFDNTGKSGFELAQGPETDERVAVYAGRAYEGRSGRLARWRAVPPVFPYGWVDAGSLLRPRTEVCAFLATYVEQPGLERRRAITLWAGARGAHRVYWNGRRRLQEPAYRGHDVDRRAAAVWLEPGDNELLVKVCSSTGSPLLSVRLADEMGRPMANLTTRAESRVGAVAHPSPTAAPALRVLGPLQSFEARSAELGDDPAQNEAFARYLDVTRGDDPAQHAALDLATRAAQAAPTVPRLLLAARLSTDHNQRTRWLERARATYDAGGDAASPSDRRALLLAEAQAQHQSLRPRAALPLYEKLLALDPDDVEALVGKIKLYEAAGLGRSALALTERAARRSPSGVLLLNLYASQLASLGRQREAEEAAHLYSAFRFDDHRPLVERLELDVARARPEHAAHWASRLLQSSPSSVWARGVVARSQRALGLEQRALASHRQALSIAPEDVDALRQLSDLHGERGEQREQLELLGRLLAVEPQNEGVRRYVEALGPAKVRSDEAYAWAPERFLAERYATADGFHSRSLVDLTVTRVYENGLSGQFRQIVFQPLTEAGARMRRRYSFTYQADRQRAELRGARVYRASGGVDEAVQSAEGPADQPELTMYTSARTVHVQFPKLEKGDVVELRYRVDDSAQKSDFAGYFGELRYLQSEVPIAHAEYVVITPKERRLYVDARGIPGLEQSVEERVDQRVHTFRAASLEPIVSEPSAPPFPELLGFVHVSTYPSYAELGTWYWGLSRDQLELDDATRALAESIAADATTTEQKVQAVYAWVVKNTRYVALEFGIYGYKPRPCVTTVARGWGDCKDKATVIASLLRHLGIDATLVLVRTGLRGRFASSVASLAPFDHAIAYVPELDLYLDGTAEFTGTRELPLMDQGATGLLVNEGAARVVTLPESGPGEHYLRRRVELALDSEGGARLQLQFETQGPSAGAFRRRYSAESTRRARLQESLAREFADFALSPGSRGLQVSDLGDFERPVVITARGEARRVLRTEADRSSLAVTLSRRLSGTYAALPRRRSPLAVTPFATVEDTFAVELARGWQVVSAPESREEVTEFGRYFVRASRDAQDRWVFDSQLSLSVSRVVPERYAEFRAFCRRADAALDQRLVLGRVAP